MFGIGSYLFNELCHKEFRVIFSRQAVLIVLGSSIPFLVNILGTFKFIELSVLDTNNSLSYALFLYWLAINRFNFLNVVPIAIQQVVNHISDGILVLSKDHLIIFFNSTLNLMLSGGVGGKKDSFLTIGDKVDGYDYLIGNDIINAVRENTNATFESTIDIHGASRYFSIEITPMFDKQKPMGTIILFKDISQHKQYISTLESKNNELDALNLKLEGLNNKLRELADKDGLTGVYNRRFFNEYYEMEIARGLNQIEHKINAKNQMNFGIAILDIDNFKKINDTYGHIVGDSILKQLVDVIKSVTFSRDFICRYGGEEFAIIFTKTTREGALEATEKIRKEVENHSFYFNDDNKNGHITISIGLAAFDEDYGVNHSNLLEIADQRLYKAKHSGKNRTVFD